MAVLAKTSFNQPSQKTIKAFVKIDRIYGTFEFNENKPGKGEYPLRGGGLINAWFHDLAVKVMYFADELSTIEENKGRI